MRNKITLILLLAGLAFSGLAFGMALGDFALVFAGQKEPGMVLIPAGEFFVGSEEGKGRFDEHPRHKVYLDAYFIDKFEVTGKDFEMYLDANPQAPPTITGWHDRKVRPDMVDRPVFGLSWKRCRDFCKWRGKRLSTEAEWERAAGGLEGRTYPWGDQAPEESRANFGRCCFVMRGLVLKNVGSYEAGKTADGIYDLAGNIAEWVYDWYDKNYYKYSEYRNPRGPEKGKYHVIRGGAWNSFSGYMRSAFRYGYNDGQDFYGIGCRCAKSAAGN